MIIMMMMEWRGLRGLIYSRLEIGIWHEECFCVSDFGMIIQYISVSYNKLRLTNSSLNLYFGKISCFFFFFPSQILLIERMTNTHNMIRLRYI